MTTYRVLTTYQTSQPGCYGWNSKVDVFNNLPDAHAMLEQLFPAGTKERRVQIDTGKSWKTLASRKPKQKIKLHTSPH